MATRTGMIWLTAELQMSDGKNAWRKMTHTQQCEYLGWILDVAPSTAGNMLSHEGDFYDFISDEEEEE